MNPTPEPSFTPQIPQGQEPTGKDWDAEYNFWHKIISEEVERLRFNGGYEPIDIDLYPSGNPAFLGKTQVGHVRFQVTANWHHDANGRKVLRIHILKAP